MTGAVTTLGVLDPAVIERRRLVQRAAHDTLRRRRTWARVVRVMCALCLVITLIPLGLLVGYTVYRGAGAWTGDFFTHLPTPEGIPGGGISNAILGTLVIDGLALAIAIPFGLLVSLFLVERPGPIATAVRFAADVFTGIPSIIIGLFAFTIIVLHTGSFSGWAASVALAVLMMPIMIRANEVAMRTVPEELWEAGLALGARQSRVVRSVVIRGALPGLVTGNLLALARAVGETAPLLFTSAFFLTTMSLDPAKPVMSLPYIIYTDANTPYKDLQQVAWGAALLLLVSVLVLSIVARVIAARLSSKAR